MDWRPKHDRDAFKEVWLLFENAARPLPALPGRAGHHRVLVHRRRGQVGQWFQRAVRLPTRQLTVRLDFPADARPAGLGRGDLARPRRRCRCVRPSCGGRAGDRAIVRMGDRRARRSTPATGWSGGSAAQQPATDAAEPGGSRASDRMRAAGILQRGDDLLRQPARQFDLPARGGDRPRTWSRRLRPALRPDRASCTRSARGSASPRRSSASPGRPPWSARPTGRPRSRVTLLNPRIVDATADDDEQYEGCLSFFDVRGLVRRPLRIDVEHARCDGSRVITTFERAMARLVAHEIDHLEGRLYVDRMAPGVPLVPIEEYAPERPAVDLPHAFLGSSGTVVA